ncbi:MAG: Crp/Fnr family transcriptional regulator [Bacteroidia bacterium]|nr:Crp/Fnr family transcriptional regulator [Bacteroidia bacterium]
MSELETYIQSYFGIEQKEMATIAALFKPEDLKKGDYYLKTGKLCNKLSFIKSGLLRIYVKDENKEVTQWISTAGYFVTDLSSLVFQNPARWTIQALSDVELYTISRNDYNRIGKLIPDWHQLEKLFIAKCFTMLEDRIFSHLSMSAEERYAFFFEHNKELFNQVPLQYIASMLGMTPETFSRIRKKTIR